VDIAVAADWKLVVEQWLEALPRPAGTRRSFLQPNQLLEVSADGALLLQVIPQSPGRCLIRRLDYSVTGRAHRSSSRPRGTQPQSPAWLQQDIEVAESTQAALAAGIDEADTTGPWPPELIEFRRAITALLPFARSRSA
jgi:hypothetical protein